MQMRLEKKRWLPAMKRVPCQMCACGYSDQTTLPGMSVRPVFIQIPIKSSEKASCAFTSEGMSPLI